MHRLPIPIPWFSGLLTGLILGLIACQFHLAAYDQTYSTFGKVLKAHVHHGSVDYKALHASSADLDQFLDETAAVGKDEFDSWRREQRLAFLINVYNGSVLKLVVSHYPIKSIKNIGGILQTPWKLPAVRLWGESTSLDQLEHGILRKEYAEPRIHFAIVCGAISCPPLRSEPFVADRLEAQLQDQGETFLRTTGKNDVELKTKTLALSSIFDWFGSDFTAQGKSLTEAITPFLEPKAAEAVKLGGFKIRFQKYDWSLNERK